MTSIVFLRNKKNGTVYAYVNEKVDSEKGPVYRRKCIGHVDPLTGEILPNRRKSDVPEASVTTCGVMMLLSKIAEDIGLTECLQIVFPDIWKEIMLISSYCLCEKTPLVYLGEWIAYNESSITRVMDAAATSSVFARISNADVESFFKVWKKRLSTKKITLMGISPMASYIDRVAHSFEEYSRFDPLVELELCYAERLPLAYVMHTLRAESSDELFAGRNNFEHLGVDSYTRLVLPELCKGDLESLIGDKRKFAMMLPEDGKAFADLMSDNWQHLFSTDNISVDSSAFTTTIRRRINGRPVYIHIYYDSNEAETKTSVFMRMVDKCRLELEHGHIVVSHYPFYEEYFIITEDEDGNAAFELNSDSIMKRSAMAGYSIIVSDSEPNPVAVKELFAINRQSETVFDNMFNETDLAGLKLYSKQMDQARVFVQFVSLILKDALREFMRTAGISGVHDTSEVLEWMKHVYHVELPGRKGALGSKLSYYQASILDAAGIKF